VSATVSQHTGGLAAHEIYERDAPSAVFVSATGVSESPSTAELVKGEGGEQGASGSFVKFVDYASSIVPVWVHLNGFAVWL
jgi:hypothetical protein